MQQALASVSVIRDPIQKVGATHLLLRTPTTYSSEILALNGIRRLLRLLRLLRLQRLQRRRLKLTIGRACGHVASSYSQRGGGWHLHLPHISHVRRALSLQGLLLLMLLRNSICKSLLSLLSLLVRLRRDWSTLLDLTEYAIGGDDHGGGGSATALNGGGELMGGAPSRRALLVLQQQAAD